MRASDGTRSQCCSYNYYWQPSQMARNSFILGLPSHPQHKIAIKQSYGFSGMVTFYIKGGLRESTRFLKKVKVFMLAESLGGVDSLCELP